MWHPISVLCGPTSEFAPILTGNGGRCVPPVDRTTALAITITPGASSTGGPLLSTTAPWAT